MGKQEVGSNTEVINIELKAVNVTTERLRPIPADRQPLVTIRGGFDSYSVKRRGNKTIIEIVSPDAEIWSEGWERPKRGPHSRKVVNNGSKAKPAPR